jgi:glutamate/tyrosine decarboxylase-like PLP-dependent enzyme
MVATGRFCDQAYERPTRDLAAASDFERIVLPGITHWQHPRFCAYFPANGSFPALLGETLTAALGAQCMSWQTWPAATELEERVLGWLRELIGLPSSFAGVSQDTASTATLCALLSARVRHHIALAGEVVSWIDQAHDFERMAPMPFATICFRYHPPTLTDEARLDALNLELLADINADGRVSLSHTRLAVHITLRLVGGQTDVERADIELAWQVITEHARRLNHRL